MGSMRILSGNIHLIAVGFRAILALEDYVTTNVIFVSLYAVKLVLFLSDSWTLVEQLRPKKRAGTERLLTIQLFSSGSSLEQ